TTAVLFTSWKKFAEANGEQAGSTKSFGQNMVKAGFRPIKNTPGAHGKRGFAGVSVRRETAGYDFNACPNGPHGAHGAVLGVRRAGARARERTRALPPHPPHSPRDRCLGIVTSFPLGPLGCGKSALRTSSAR